MKVFKAEAFIITLTYEGCFKTTTQEIVVGKGYSLIMPNTFTPNNDNINDRIGPSFTGLKEVNFYVYNKSGVLIYEESVTENSLAANSVIKVLGWDGSNSDPNSNYYVYKIIATRLNDEIITETSYSVGLANINVSAIAALSGYLDPRVVSFVNAKKAIYVSHGKQDMVVPYAWARSRCSMNEYF